MQGNTQISDAMVDAALDAYHSADGTPFAPPDVCMRAALSAALAGHVVGWQPIETAPRGFKPVLYFSPFYGPVSGCEPEGYLRGQWIKGGGGQCDHRLKDATHWMPLPAPPAQREG